jgi:hypothetical protein
MINPTGMVNSDRLILNLFSNWLHNKELKWESIAEKFSIPESFYNYKEWFSSPFISPTLESLLEEERDPLRFFNLNIVEWQSELKLEWYPALHRLFLELRMYAGLTGDSEWYRQRFLPYSAERLEVNSERRGNFVL